MVNLSIDMNDYTNSSRRKKTCFRAILGVLFLVSFLILPKAVQAQATSYPEYEVVYGDTLSWIALRFDTTVEDIISLNALGPDNVLRPGDRLKIPTLAGMHGILVTEFVPLGSSLTSLSRRSQTEPADLIKANQLTSPSELFIGREIVMTRSEEDPPMETMDSLKTGQSF